jgi:hypothetical protein
LNDWLGGSAPHGNIAATLTNRHCASWTLNLPRLVTAGVRENLKDVLTKIESQVSRTWYYLEAGKCLAKVDCPAI